MVSVFYSKLLLSFFVSMHFLSCLLSRASFLSPRRISLFHHSFLSNLFLFFCFLISKLIINLSCCFLKAFSISFYASYLTVTVPTLVKLLLKALEISFLYNKYCCTIFKPMNQLFTVHHLRQSHNP